MKQRGGMLLGLVFILFIFFGAVQSLTLILKYNSSRITQRIWFYKLHFACRSALRFSDTLIDSIPSASSSDPEWYFEFYDNGYLVDWFDPPVYLFRTEDYVYAVTQRLPYRGILRQGYTVESETVILLHIEDVKD